MTDIPPDTRRLLHECTAALARLLGCPDLNLEHVEPATRDAIEQAQHVLEAVQTHQPPVRCVVCGTPLPGVHFTDADRGHLVAYAHHACAAQVGLAGPHRSPTDPTSS